MGKSTWNKVGDGQENGLIFKQRLRMVVITEKECKLSGFLDAKVCAQAPINMTFSTCYLKKNVFHLDLSQEAGHMECGENALKASTGSFA